MDGPNPLRAAWSMMRARRVATPGEFGTGELDHGRFGPVLEALRAGGIPALVEGRSDLAAYLAHLGSVDPSGLGRSEALAFWLNLYNACALDLAIEAQIDGGGSVLRVPGAFDGARVEIAGEALSLDDIEHGKVRRFGDPRIHAALVCGSVSCPTLRSEPYEGARLHDQLDDQMNRFLASGAAVPDPPAGKVTLSRVFLWYGGDFTRPNRMPTWLPARRRALLASLAPWLTPSLAAWIADTRPGVGFQSYDWGLRCAVG